ncbi:hypothetical protein AURDEDRAFT_129379 [Auricularia subglabra TFB-10046 SS5]|nr:hypothetical protein AURDEDRAFT_129379 [Auricularia subglabra TFB-10046 SS5]
MSFHTADLVKWCGEFGSLCCKAAGLLGGAKLLKVGLAKVQDRRVSSIQGIWMETARILKDAQTGGNPEQDYFPEFLNACERNLARIMRETESLEKRSEEDPDGFGKYIGFQKDYARQAKEKIDALRELQMSLRVSRVQAQYLKANGHPIPRDDEILRPTGVNWPDGGIPWSQTISPDNHLLLRELDESFTTRQRACQSPSSSSPSSSSPSSSSPSSSSPSSSSADPYNGFGSTLPGAPPTGESVYPYLPAQAPVAGPLFQLGSNSMPVPRDYAHFNNLNSSAYGHAVSAQPHSPYVNPEYAASTASTTAYAFPGGYPAPVPRRR